MHIQNTLVVSVRGFALALLLVFGSAATVFAQPINLAWDPSASPVNGYIVHVGTQPMAYSLRYDVGPSTSFTYPDAVAGQRYCFAVSAYSSTGDSPLSSEVCGYSDAPPTLANPGNRSAVVGTATSLQLSGSDPYGQPVSYTASGLTPGLSLSTTTGFISGVGTTAGTYAVSARAYDGRLYSTAQSFTWTMTAPAYTAPTISIAGPTSASSYSTTNESVSLSGIASASAGLAQVSWTSDRGISGVASGTTNWNTAPIPLQGGTNVLTVVARDAAGNQAADVLTITYSAPPPPALVMLSATPSVARGRKNVALSWTACAWRLVDVYRDGLPLATTENDGSHLDTMKKGGSYSYRVCETGNRANCSNSVTVYF